MCRPTCFGRLHAHHQELTTALTTSGFTLECGGSSVVGRGLAGQITTNNAATTTSVNLFELYDDARTCQRKKKKASTCFSVKHHHQRAHYLSLAKVTIVKMS